jgi:hypothetical protein
MSGRAPDASGASSSRARRFVLLGTVAAATSSAACGGGLALLHPAQTLDRGEVRATGGFSENVAVGSLASALATARSEAAAQGGASASTAYARGALAAASVSGGLAPIVAARVGLGWRAEGGLTYSGRAVRADVRRSFDVAPHWALSAGVGGTGVLYGREEDGDLPGLELQALHGWGADVPVLVGYESEGRLYSVWLGLRGGWEHVDIGSIGNEPISVPSGSTAATLSATRWWGGGLLGLAVGFRHVHVAMEIDASDANVAGDFAQTHASVAGVTLSPAAALTWDF